MKVVFSRDEQAVLLEVLRGPGISESQLASSTGLGRFRVSYVCYSLARKGWLELSGVVGRSYRPTERLDSLVRSRNQSRGQRGTQSASEAPVAKRSAASGAESTSRTWALPGGWQGAVGQDPSVLTPAHLHPGRLQAKGSK